MFFLLFEKAVRVAMSAAHHPKLLTTKCGLADSFTPANQDSETALFTPQFDRGIDFFACRFSGQELSTPDLGEPLGAGNIFSNRHFAVPYVIGFRFENADRALAEHG